MVPLFNIFGKTIGIYQIMILCGIFATGIYCSLISKKLKRNDNDTIIFLLFISIGVFAGGSILYGVVNHPYIIYAINNIHKIDSWAKLWNTLQVIFGGSVFYGGLLGGLLVTAIYLRIKPGHRYIVDIVAPGIPLFHFFGRIGCFLGGCCYGIESSCGFTMHHSPIPQANEVSRFPVQLLEAVFNLGLFILLHFFLKKGKFKDRLLYLYLLCYSFTRFFLEFLRGDEHRGLFFGVSTSQIISIFVLFIVSLILFFRSPSKVNKRHD